MNLNPESAKSLEKAPMEAGRGALILQENECGTCHLVNGTGAKVNGLSVRRTPRWIEEIRNPNAHLTIARRTQLDITADLATRRSRSTLLCLLSTVALSTSLRAADWPQWGGPQRNFMIESTGLAKSWPVDGPRRLWSRELGEGYSGIAVDGGRLFTLVHRDNQEVVIALEAETGRTLWEYSYDVTFLKDMNMDKGSGPHSTPLVDGMRVFTTGVTGQLHSLDKETGRPVWSHDLHKEFNATVLARGYSSSPIAYRDLVIVPVGGRQHGLIAFRQKGGSVAWKGQDFNNSHSSPTLIQFEGQDQLVVLMHKVIAGLDPQSGELIWSLPHEVIGDHIVFTPLWGSDNLLFYSSAYNGGSRLLRLSRSDGKTHAEELWFNNKMRVHHGNVIRIGDCIYGSSGDFGPAFLTALDVRTGKVLWQERSFAKAMLLYADGKFIILDEDGHLSLAKLNRQGVEIVSRAEILSSNAWTPPSLVGTKLYLRDRKKLLALELRP
jgi:outer membrane protein assembly factor BamB